MSEINHPTGSQLAAARALVGLGQAEVASAAKVSLPTLRRMEASKGVAAGMKNNVSAVVAVLEQAGVQFLADGDVATGPGVALTA